MFTSPPPGERRGPRRLATGLMRARSLAAAAPRSALARARLRGRRGRGGTITADGSSTVGPFTPRQRKTSRPERTSTSRSASPAPAAASSGSAVGETDLSNASRAIEDEEAAICAERRSSTSSSVVATDALTNVVNTENDWATCLTVDQLNAIWKPGSTVKSWNQVDAVVPRRPTQPVRARHRLGHVRLLHRRDQRRGGREPHRLHAERGRQRDRPGRLGRARRARLLRLLVLRGEPGHAQGGRGRRRRRLRRRRASRRPRTARTRRSPARSSSTSARARSTSTRTSATS